MAKRGDGWTKKNEDIFFAVLAETCNVSAALRAADMSSGSAYARRQKYAEFRAKWALAVREGYARLELTLLDRAMNGTVKTVEKADGSIDRTTEYPNAVALALLRMHRESAAAAEMVHEPAAIEEVRARIVKKLGVVKARIEAEGVLE